MRMRAAAKMTSAELSSELRKLGKKWDRFRAGDCDGGGSPGEWMVERMGELETEQRRRRAEGVSA